MSNPLALGIVGCEVMEDEISHLVGRDMDVVNVLLIDATGSNRMEQKILGIGPNKNVLRVNCPDVLPELDLRPWSFR